MTREEAVEIVRNIYQTDAEKEALAVLVPELRESEDERIIKTLQEYVKNRNWPLNGPTQDEVLAYLEKQKEQKPAERSLEDDHIIGFVYDLLNEIEWKDNWAMSKEECLRRLNNYRPQKPAEWDEYTKMNLDRALQIIKDAKGNLQGYQSDDGIYECDKAIECLEHFLYRGLEIEKTVEWSDDYREEDIQTRFAFYTYKDDPSVLYLSNVFVEESSRNHGFGTRILKAAEKVAETVGAITISLKVKQDSPANAWYRKRGYGYVAFEDGYDWLEKNLEYLKPVKQAEWSDEDSDNLERVDNYLWMLDDYVGDDCATPQGKADKIRENIQKVLSPWIKSLPERFNLQAKEELSEEDEKELDYIINILDRLGFEEFCKSSRDQDIEEERFYYEEIQFLKRLKTLLCNKNKR